MNRSRNRIPRFVPSQRRRFSSFFPALLLGTAGLFGQAQLPDIPELSLQTFSPASRTAIQRYADRVRESPSDADRNGELGMQLHTYEQYGLAEICYRRAHLLDPQRFQWLYLLGVVQDLSGKKEESVSNLKRAMDLNPGYLPGKVRLAEALLNAARVEESIREFQDALAQQDDLPLALYGLGRALMTLGDTASAIGYLTRAVALYSEFGSAHYSLGIAYRDLGEREKAREHLGLYREHQNKWPASGDFFLNWVKNLKEGPLEHLSRGVSLAKNNRQEEAIQEHLKAIELDPELTQAHINLIQLYGAKSSWKEAEYHCRKALELQPDIAETHYNCGVMIASQDRAAQAIQYFGRALEINPHFAQAHNNLGNLLLGKGEKEEALSHFQSALLNDPSFRLARFNLGRTLVSLERYEEAIAEFEKIVTPEDDSTPRYLFALATAYVRKGDLKRGLELSETARDRAEEWGQGDLAKKIERDLQILRGALDSR